MLLLVSGLSELGVAMLLVTRRAFDARLLVVVMVVYRYGYKLELRVVASRSQREG
jgi:hypothetical protein